MRGYRGARCAVTGAKVRGYGGTRMRGYGGKNGLETRMNKRFHLPVTRARVLNYLTKSFNRENRGPYGADQQQGKIPASGAGNHHQKMPRQLAAEAARFGSGE